MKYKIALSGQYQKDLKLARKRHLNEDKLNMVIYRLSMGMSLEPHHKDHALVGSWSSYRECHISPDWLLIYRIKDKLEILELTRTGTHSDLFGK
jgi:mRNA interferase YafQ